MRLIKQAKRVVLVPASFLAAGAAMATEPASIDTSGLVATIEGALTPVGAVGLAVLGVLAGIMVFTLIRRVMR